MAGHRRRGAASVHPRAVVAAQAAWFRQQAGLPLGGRVGGWLAGALPAAASAQRGLSSLPAAAAVGAAVYVRAALRWAASAAGYGPEAAEVAASDARAQPQAAAGAEPGAEL